MTDRPKWLQDWINYFWATTEEEKSELAALRVDVDELKEWKTKMTQEFDDLKATTEKMESLLQSTADGLAAALKQLANPPANPDAAAMVALNSEVQAKLAAVAAELPAPTPAA